jgi:hypothetical protein
MTCGSQATREIIDLRIMLATVAVNIDPQFCRFEYNYQLTEAVVMMQGTGHAAGPQTTTDGPTSQSQASPFSGQLSTLLHCDVWPASRW